MIYQGVCDSFKKELFEGIHDFTSDTFKLALYSDSADLTTATTAYSAVGEISGTNYTAGGSVVTPSTPVLSNSVVIQDFADLTFTNLTASGIRGALIYNSSKANRAVVVLDFGIAKSRTAEDLVITFPPATSTEAVVRIL